MTPKKKSDRPVIQDGDFSTASDGLNGNRVFVSIAKTINLGNYESLRVEFGVGRIVNDGQVFDDVLSACKLEVGKNLNEMICIVEGNKK